MLDADATVALLTESPDRTALLLDFDGSLSPVVDRPEDAEPLPGAVDVVTALVAAVGRVALVSGRPVDFLAARMPVAGLVYAGQYGMELVERGVRTVDPRALAYVDAIAAAADDAERLLPDVLVERKADLGVALHWRTTPDRREAVVALAGELATRYGLAELGARMAIELRPPVSVDKGDAVDALIPGYEVAAYAGDDLGDVRGLDALARARRDGRLKGAAAIAVRSAETPPALLDAADLVVDGPSSLVALLRRVVDEIGEPARGRSRRGQLP